MIESLGEWGQCWTARVERGSRIFWLLLQREHAELCVQDPGFEVDLCIDADLASMAKVWLGDITFDMAVRGGQVQLKGPLELWRAFPTWLLLSHFASVPRP